MFPRTYRQGRYAGNNYAAFEYDEKGRVRSGSWIWPSVSHQTATYEYVPGTALVKSLTIENERTGDKTVTTYDYEPRRNLRTMIRNEFVRANSAELVSQYDYKYDAFGRVETETAKGRDIKSLSPYCSIDMSSQAKVDRYMRVQKGIQRGDDIPAIDITPGSNGVKIKDIIFDTTGEL